MADDDTNLPPDYDLVPVDHTPQFSDAPIPKAGQTVQQPNVMGDISSMPGKVASAVGDVTGVSDAYKAATGQMTPEEAQMFALGALPMLAGGPEAKVAEELAPSVAKTAKGIVQDIATYAGEHGAPDMESGSPLHNVTLNGTYPTDFYSNKGLQYYAPGHDTPGVDAGVYHKIVATKDQPDQMVSAYRAIPWEGKRPQFTLNSGGPSGAVINPGDWVTLSRQYAKDHGESALNGQYAIVSKKVPARELFTNGDSYHEWGWDPRASQPQAAPEPPQPQGIRAYHGSPYDFNQFDLSKIGTGEGAQAYGHGLYFAENPEVANLYSRVVSANKPGWQGVNPPAFDSLKPDELSKIPDDMRGRLVASWQNNGGDVAQNLAKQMFEQSRGKEYSDALHSLAYKGDWAAPGKRYEVNINADPEHFLDWDKPLSEQSQHVKDAVAKVDASIAPTAPNISQIKDPQIRGVVKNALKQNDGQVDGLELMIDNDSGLYNTAVAHAKRNGVDLEKNDMRASDYVYQQAKGYIDALHASQNLMGDSLAKVLGVKGADMMQAGPAAARLRDAGIPGIKYLDQGSRGQTTWTAIHPQGGINDFPNEQQARAFVAKNPEYSLEAPKQTSNYVVFNDKLIDIVKKYGLAGLVAGGASHFSTVPVDHQPDFPDQNGMADGGVVDDATDAPTDPTNSIAPLATALNQAVPNFDPEAAGFRPSTNIEDVRNKPLWRKAIETITRKPLPGDLTNYAKGGSIKATKTQANYRGGTAKKRCGICSMFVAPSGCTAVRGVISARALCDFFERKAQERANGGRVDVANIEHEPSEAQKEAGNYAKDHVRVHGLDITIENAKGGYRRGVGRDGKPWSVKMPAHYGYIKGTVGKDKDHVDVYLGPHLKSPTVFVVDQVDHETKKFDEHKAFLGFASPRQVMDTYQKAFSDGKAMQRLGHLTGMSIEEFKNWLATGDMKKKADDHFADAVKIDATHDGPWMSCMSIDGATMYRNKNIPATANIKGKTVDVDDMLLHHEVPERADLEKLIAEFKARFHHEPNTRERKGIYLKAHNRSGTPNERAHARKIGVDWKAWSAWCRGEESKIEKMKFTNQPKDADVKPIPHSHEELEAMDHASAA